ncbi:SIMPL domain-containing protein [Methanocella arvoryzae]|uniref:SIMPL domain-containing protein n=1 Tax=Methanocella arvoryzae TaxID=1175445 RepID=UPI001E46B565|nr:SIMPL domain-containing protein [Methanocella arvoryzae]
MLCALFLISLTAGSAYAADGTDDDTDGNLSEKAGTINVNGHGTVYSEPDVAKVTIGVITEAATSTQAMADNANKMSSVVAGIKSVGIPDRDIQTATISVEPEYASENPSNSAMIYPPPAKQNITGYKATNTVTVTVRDLSKVGGVIDAATSAGSNEIQGVTFMLSDERQSRVYQEALQKAIMDGAAKAKNISSAAGITDYKLKSVSESGPGYPVYSYEGAGGAMMARAAAAPTPVSTGEIKVEASVSMRYTFVPR